MVIQAERLASPIEMEVGTLVDCDGKVITERDEAIDKAKRAMRSDRPLP
jgi:tartrate dehydratase beta subunit/fumarate hydratase class I family protein